MRTPFPKVRGIVATPCTCFGAPRFEGTRIHVEAIAGCLCGGDSEEDVRDGYNLTREQMRAYHRYMWALMFRNWADNAREVTR
jgi:uncharacterized protein (DUF433 family)